MPSNRAARPRRTSSFPTKRCPQRSGPRGASKTQSSEKCDMIASRSCSLKPSSTWRSISMVTTDDMATSPRVVRHPRPMSSIR
jgi:hypothetical protein